MFRSITLLIATLLIIIGSISAQDAEPARMRVMQLSFANSEATVDVRVDGEVVFTGIPWPFVTDYVELALGDHTLTTTLADQSATASTSLMLEAGRSYSVVVHGDYREGVTFTVIDESDLPLAETGGGAIILNLTPEPITDLRVNSAPARDLIPPGEHAFLNLPAAPFTIAGQLGGLAYREGFTPLSNAILLGVVRMTPDGDLQIIYQRSSHLTVAEYLKSIGPDALFSGFAGALAPEVVDTTLPDDGTYTLFLPTNQALEQVGVLIEGASEAAFLAGHTTAQSLPPTILPNHNARPMLNGRTAQLAFSATPSGYWEIDGAAILWDLRLANGVIYAIDGVLGAQGG